MGAISEQPLWKQVAARLREDITSGRYGDGDLFPTGAELAAEYGVNQQTTIRRAVEVLEREGLVTEGHGRLGRKVRLRKPFVHDATASESAKRIEERRESGKDAWVYETDQQGWAGGQDISVAVRKAPADVASRLRLGGGEDAVVRHRVRTLDGEAHNLNDTWYDLRIAEGTAIMSPADVKPGVIALMRDMGYVQHHYSDEVLARMPTTEEAGRLRIPSDTIPVLVQYRVGYTEDGKPLKLTITVWPADRTRLYWEFPA